MVRQSGPHWRLLRTNRTGHTKIMRCFPHCCPDHRRRNYCGSSVHVRVVPTESAVLNPREIVVYGRFRPADGIAIRIGEGIPETTITTNLLRLKPSNGEWVEARLRCYEHRSWLFEVNPSGLWYYPWGGVATLAMQATYHVLEVYVFRRIGGERLQLIGRVQSSKFRLMSYRRRAALISQRDTAVLDDDEQKSEVPSTSERAPSIPSGPPPGTSTPASTQNEEEDSELSSRDLQKRSCLNDASESVTGAHSSSPIVQSPFPSEWPTRIAVPRSEGAQTTLIQIARWLHRIPLNLFSTHTIRSWERVVRDAIQTDSGAQQSCAAGFVPFVSMLEDHAHSSRFDHNISSVITRHEATDACVRLLLHLWLSKETRVASLHAIDVFVNDQFIADPGVFSSMYRRWYRDMEARARRFVNAELHISWGQLVPLSPMVECEDQDRGSFTCRDFIAQCRERLAYHSKQASNHQEVRSSVLRSRILQSPVWKCYMDDVFTESQGLAQHMPSVLLLVQMWRHLSCVRLAFDKHEWALSVASWFNRAEESSAYFATLTLDGRYRWLNCLPTGDTTTGTTLLGYIVGDYIGRVTPGGVVDLTTFYWTINSLDDSSCVYAWHWTLDALALGSETATDTVTVSVDVKCSSITRRCGSAFETQTIQEKLSSVRRWMPVTRLELTYRRWPNPRGRVHSSIPRTSPNDSPPEFDKIMPFIRDSEFGSPE